ncbi:hypothetical protein AAVH_11722 [Aphelenchoides avenae]|nr:hypothetical protein AAVH_11722 [Aphelenchus avenae]
MLATVSSFLRDRQSKVREAVAGKRKQEPSTEPRATGPGATSVTLKPQEPFTSARALSRTGGWHSASEGDSVRLVIGSLEELSHATADRPLCGPPARILGHVWQLEAYLLEADDGTKLKCLLHCVLDNADETLLKVSCTLSAISEAAGNPSVSVNAEKLVGGSESYCAFNLRHYAALFGPSKDTSLKIEARLTSVTPITVPTMLSSTDPSVPAFEAPPAGESSIATMRALLRQEREANERLRQTIQEERAEREAAEAFVDEMLQGRLEEVHTVLAQFQAELEQRERKEHAPEDVKEQIMDKQVAALKAELRTETHFALLRQAKIRELRAEKAEYELEKRQLKHMLVAAIEKHAETARQLQTTQEVLPKLVESFERQHEALAKCADREQSLREEVTELRVLAESARFYHEEQTKTLRKQLAQAARTPLTDYISGVNDDASALKDLQEQVSTLEGQVCCGICMDRQRSVSFDCGHTTCHECAESLRECHICRSPIRERHPIYL